MGAILPLCNKRSLFGTQCRPVGIPIVDRTTERVKRILAEPHPKT
ncbi:BgTH12-05583 [Blumeria graminis f. sp. triticale]|uniref:BgTH12-05583 n=1 Tax=Blumeria graminis f. sp. triticale TaxID=1689686 RepID=A0A9W4D3V4_BLUGR|nr:BgTH12-05583 [Blumeria graminis f. sp. triticale]